MKHCYKNLMIIFIAAVCLGFVIGDSLMLCAQESSTDVFTLEEITVTAQKREENQQKVAIAMDVISSEEIQEFGKNDIDEILSNISSALIQKAADGYRVSIRGMSDDSSAWSSGQSMATPTVAINTDGVYSNRKDTGSGLYDLERVEVLYGPQSTMYSSTSPGGIINVVTAQPKIDTYEGSGTIEFGNYNLLHTEGVLNVPLGSKTALRAAFSTSRHDGYVSNGSDNEDSKSARLRFLFQPNDRLSFTVTGELYSDNGSGFGAVDGFVYQDEPDDPWTAVEDQSLMFNDTTSKKIYGQMDLDTGFGDLTLTPSYSKRNGTAKIIDSDDAVTYQDENTSEEGLELRMTSPEDFFFKWIWGATYYNSKDYRGSDENEMDSRQKNKAYYVNITYPVIDILRVTAGYRQSWDKLSTHNIQVMGTGELLDENLTQENPGNSDYKIGFEYDLAENSMIYADYSTSYRVQGMSRTTTGATKLKAYSIGAKNRFLDNKLQLNASAYYYDYQGYQANQRVTVWVADLDKDNIMDEYQYSPGEDYNPEAETAVDPNAVTTGDGRVMGFDVQSSFIVTPKDQLNLSVSYIDSKWTDFVFDYYYDQQYELVNGVATLVDLEDEDYAGKPMFNSPPWTVILAYNHNFDLSNGGYLKVGVNSKLQTSYRMSWKDSDYPYNYQETYHIEGINATYSHPGDKWNLSSYVKNVFNYAEKRNYESAQGTGSGTLMIGNPRTYGVVLSVRF